MNAIAVVQMASGPQLNANLMEAGRLIQEAASAGARLVVLPETFVLMAMQDRDRITIAEPLGYGPIQEFLVRKARQHRVWIVGGTIPIQSHDPMRPYATCLVINDEGELVGRYNKIHLFDVTVEQDEIGSYAESQFTSPGNELTILDSPFGRLGLSVCYDLRFPELYRELALRGAELFIVPSAFTAVTGQAHWEVLLRARAIENLCYVVAAAQGGYHVNGRATYGHSMVIDHWGQIRGQLAKGSGVVVVEPDLATLHSTRHSFPVLAHTRLAVPTY